MRFIINSLALIGIATGLISMIQLYRLNLGSVGAQGFASVTLPLWALIGAAMAILFGFLGRYMDRRVPRPAARLSNIAIALGLIIGAATLAVPFVFP